MKTYLQRLLCCGLLILTAPFVHAVNVSSNDRGEVLLFPLYTAQNGWDTYLNLFTQGGLVHIKFRSAQTGEVLDSFHIYGGAASTFRASLSTIAPGKTVMRVAEGQCVIGGQVGSEVLHQGGVGTDLPLSADIGFIEAFATGLTMNGMQPEYGRTGFSCAEYAANWATNGRWQTHPDADMDAAGYTAQIHGTVNFVNVTQGLSSANHATALTNTGARFTHQHPTRNTLDLTQTQGGIEAVAQALHVTGISNIVDNSSDVNAYTEWVVTYPLVGYGYEKPYTVQEDGGDLTCGGWTVITDTNELGSLRSGGIISIDGSSTGIYEDTLDFILPAPSLAPFFCEAANIQYFQRLRPNSSSLSTASNRLSFVSVVAWQSWFTQVSFEFERPEDGELPVYPDRRHVPQAPTNVTYRPMKHPVIGFRLTSYENGTLNGGGTLANYSFLTPHTFGCDSKDGQRCKD